MKFRFFNQKATLVTFILGIVASSCYKEPVFSLTPEITYAGFEKEILVDAFSGANKDSLVISLDFTDGDGDLGLSETEKAAAEQKQEYNFFVKTFRKKNGKITEFTPFIPYSGFFPRLKNDDRPGPIKGTLSYSIEFPHPFTPKRDSLQFQVYIKDRAGNLSNVATTDVIVLNEF
jgi:hypothetical protein